MKTAFNEMLDYFNHCADDNMKPEVFFEWLRENKSRLLEKEKKQITDAFSDGVHECDARGDWVCDYDDCLDYFNEMY